MTIDSSWIACFKEEVPEAFRPTPPFAPSAVFCDGQIKLMPAAIEGVVTWEDYIQRQFSGQIRRYFTRGVSCVILAFDDYNHVPQAKSMTQVRVYSIKCRKAPPSSHWQHHSTCSRCLCGDFRAPVCRLGTHLHNECA